MNHFSLNPPKENNYLIVTAINKEYLIYAVLSIIGKSLRFDFNNRCKRNKFEVSLDNNKNIHKILTGNSL